MNQFEIAKRFYESASPQILQCPSNDWAIDAYAWDGEGITMTPIESALWSDIRQLNAVFYPQYPIGKFFADFANPVAKVVLECDGAEFHQDKEKDAKRDKEMMSMGWTVYRFAGWQCKREQDDETGELPAHYLELKRICAFHKVIRGA